VNESSANEQFAMHQMTEEECFTALSSHAFGRLAFSLDEGPTILPVNYAYVEHSIVIRSSPGSKLANSPLTTVAFEIDEVDPDHAWGWSVVARGHAFDITNAIDEFSQSLRELPLVPWTAGEKMHVLKISVKEVTGRRFGNAPDL
jgi:nitroimidazol reductase NimA-like FMN-containing flavoprotein (pyridoxamine 5'-phosphate oxidase superfamily)